MDYDAQIQEWNAWVDAVITEFIWLADRPLVPTDNVKSALTAMFYAKNCPHAAARSICAQMGIDTSHDPDPCGHEDPDGSGEEETYQG